jgi:UrcA family protein
MKSSHYRALRLRACLLAGSWALAPAAYPATVPSALVRYADLDLNQARDVSVLYSRIRSAAREVCAPYETAGSLLPSAAWHGCFTQAVANAVRRVDRPLLTAYHQRQEGHV